MNYTRREFVKTLFVASSAVAWGASKLLSEQEAVRLPRGASLNFVAIGDWGRRGRPDQREVAQQMALSAAQIDAQFVLNVGDNFYHDGVASVDDSHWQESFENVYHAPSLQIPWYCLLGNHDYNGEVEPQLAYGKTHARWVLPNRYYSFRTTRSDVVSAEFFCLDTNPFILDYRITVEANRQRNVLAQIDTVPHQVRWLEEGLARSTADWKIVVGHHPLYSAGSAHGDQPEIIEAILPILKKQHVQVYFNGHDHNLQHLESEGINFFTTGAGSEHLPIKETERNKFVQDISGFTTIYLKRDTMEVSMIDNRGALLYTATVKRTV